MLQPTEHQSFARVNELHRTVKDFLDGDRAYLFPLASLKRPFDPIARNSNRNYLLEYAS